MIKAIIEALPQLLNLISFFLKKVTKTPAELRRASLIELDDAFKLAREKDDLRELSQWFGKRL